MIDVSHEISSVERRIGGRDARSRRGPHAGRSRVYDTPPEDLWDACTNPERLPRWFLPVSGDLRDGRALRARGQRLRHDRALRGAPQRSTRRGSTAARVSWIELRLTPEGEGRTRFALEHIAHVGDDLWAQFGPVPSASAGTRRSWRSPSTRRRGRRAASRPGVTEEGIEFVRFSAWPRSSEDAASKFQRRLSSRRGCGPTPASPPAPTPTRRAPRRRSHDRVLQRDAQAFTQYDAKNRSQMGTAVYYQVEGSSNFLSSSMMIPGPEVRRARAYGGNQKVVVTRTLLKSFPRSWARPPGR